MLIESIIYEDPVDETVRAIFCSVIKLLHVVPPVTVDAGTVGRLKVVEQSPFKQSFITPLKSS